MKVQTHRLTYQTRGFSHVLDITEDVKKILESSPVRSGNLTLFVVGSTAAISTIEYEPGLVEDIQGALEKIAPLKGQYAHHQRWHDDNGSAHIRATLMGPSLTVPFAEGELFLGTWQQIVLLDFDTRPREREVVVQVIGVE
ncbi:MAG: YjbQ family protein [Planctomycetota bacterium]|nr:MAG: YjbQ family protein [Planctomycetota bacterium]